MPCSSGPHRSPSQRALRARSYFETLSRSGRARQQLSAHRSSFASDCLAKDGGTHFYSVDVRVSSKVSLSSPQQKKVAVCLPSCLSSIHFIYFLRCGMDSVGSTVLPQYVASFREIKKSHILRQSHASGPRQEAYKKKREEAACYAADARWKKKARERNPNQRTKKLPKAAETSAVGEASTQGKAGSHDEDMSKGC